MTTQLNEHLQGIIEDASYLSQKEDLRQKLKKTRKEIFCQKNTWESLMNQAQEQSEYLITQIKILFDHDEQLMKEYQNIVDKYQQLEDLYKQMDTMHYEILEKYWKLEDDYKQLIDCEHTLVNLTCKKED